MNETLMSDENKKTEPKVVTMGSIDKVFDDLDRWCATYALEHDAGGEMLVALQVYSHAIRAQTAPSEVDAGAAMYAAWRLARSAKGTS